MRSSDEFGTAKHSSTSFGPSRNDRRAEVELEKASPSSPFGPGAKGWENCTVEDFLGAALSWAEDVERTEDARAGWFPAAPSWEAFARFLYLGKIYE